MFAIEAVPNTGNPGGKKLKPSTRGMISSNKRTSGIKVVAVTASEKRLRLWLVDLFNGCFTRSSILAKRSSARFDIALRTTSPNSVGMEASRSQGDGTGA